MEVSVSERRHTFFARKTNIIESNSPPGEPAGEVVAWFQWLLSLRVWFG